MFSNVKHSVRSEKEKANRHQGDFILTSFLWYADDGWKWYPVKNPDNWICFENYEGVALDGEIENVADLISSIHSKCKKPRYQKMEAASLGYPLFDILSILQFMRFCQHSEVKMQAVVRTYLYDLFCKHLKKQNYPRLYANILTHYVLTNDLNEKIYPILIDETMRYYYYMLKHSNHKSPFHNKFFDKNNDDKTVEKLIKHRKLITKCYFIPFERESIMLGMIEAFTHFCMCRVRDRNLKLNHTLTCLDFLCKKQNEYSIFPLKKDPTHKFIIRVLLKPLFDINCSTGSCMNYEIRYIVDKNIIESILRKFIYQIENNKKHKYDASDQFDLWSMMAQFYCVHKNNPKLAQFCCNKALDVVKYRYDQQHYQDSRYINDKDVVYQDWCGTHLQTIDLLGGYKQKHKQYVRIGQIMGSKIGVTQDQVKRVFPRLCDNIARERRTFRIDSSQAQHERFIFDKLLLASDGDKSDAGVDDGETCNHNINVINNIAMSKECHYSKCRKKNVKLKMCNRCRSVYYCSKLCQKKDWVYCLQQKCKKSHKECCTLSDQRVYL